MRLDLPFFRAKRTGGGTAAVLQFNNGTAFLNTGAQTGPMLPSGGAPFDFKSPDKAITLKLGLPDLSAMLAAYRSVRLAGTTVPAKHRAYSSDPNRDMTRTLGLVHKYQPKGATTPQSKSLSWAFSDDGSFIGLSNGTLRQSIPLTHADEVLIACYLERVIGELLVTSEYLKEG